MDFKITPIENTPNFTVGKKYEVLAKGQDLNLQPTMLVADNDQRLRYVEAEDFKYCPGTSVSQAQPIKRTRAPNKKPAPRASSTS